jgi:hypothetical protein
VLPQIAVISVDLSTITDTRRGFAPYPRVLDYCHNIGTVSLTGSKVHPIVILCNGCEDYTTLVPRDNSWLREIGYLAVDAPFVQETRYQTLNGQQTDFMK